jgi:hypothetical protein
MAIQGQHTNRSAAGSGGHPLNRGALQSDHPAAVQTTRADRALVRRAHCAIAARPRLWSCGHCDQLGTPTWGPGHRSVSMGCRKEIVEAVRQSFALRWNPAAAGAGHRREGTPEGSGNRSPSGSGEPQDLLAANDPLGRGNRRIAASDAPASFIMRRRMSGSSMPYTLMWSVLVSQPVTRRTASTHCSGRRPPCFLSRARQTSALDRPSAPPAMEL